MLLCSARDDGLQIMAHAHGNEGLKRAVPTGVAPHGDNAREFVFMVAAGMKPLDAIRSATLAAATLLGTEQDVGTIEAGKFADLVAVPGNLLADITLVSKVSFVMQSGTIYKQ